MRNILFPVPGNIYFVVDIDIGRALNSTMEDVHTLIANPKHLLHNGISCLSIRDVAENILQHTVVVMKDKIVRRDHDLKILFRECVDAGADPSVVTCGDGG